MRLKQRLLELTEKQRLVFDDSLKGRFRIGIGDKFNSSICSLVDDAYSDLTREVSKFSDNAEFFLPDLLVKGLVGLVRGEDGVEQVTSYRFEVTGVLNRNLGDIANVFFAKPLHKTSIGRIQYSKAEDRVNAVKESADGFVEIHNGDKIIRCRGPIPPYPRNYQLPPEVITPRISGVDGSMHFPILAGSDKVHVLRKGDTFNAICMSYKGPGGDFRIFQFLPHYLGYARTSKGHEIDSSIPTLDYLLLHINLAYRFEVTGVMCRPTKQSRAKIVYCRPLAVDFTEQGPFDDPWQNLVYNMTNVNLQRRA